ncbi:hypothetical protein HPP92_010268 [Vanilla planifolia]|uniref:4-coumarate--CoA ligase n=1 Tax=Vanilla planifolia TaxID=51239 RepID=A0A835UZX5_VANPL|nr:hypothetical protein HPP92_010268 [Vanilla planifolia]
MHRLGVRQGDVIMILLPNSPEFAFVFLGASMLGAISTTANPFYTPAEVNKQAQSITTALSSRNPVISTRSKIWVSNCLYRRSELRRDLGHQRGGASRGGDKPYRRGGPALLIGDDGATKGVMC